MRTEDLRYFLSVAKVGTLGSASEALGITQPGLTKAISRLEAELGGPLFHRTGRGMVLTELGASFEKRAQHMIDEVNHAMAEARAYSPVEEGVIRLGIALQLQPLALTLCGQFLQRRPLVRFEMQHNISDHLEAGLAEGRLDLALASEPTQLSDELQFHPVTSAEVRVVAGIHHPLAHPLRALTLADLTGHDWVLPSSGTALRRRLSEIFRTRGLPEPVARIEIEDCSPVLPLIGSIGLLSISPVYAMRDIPANPIVALPISDLNWERRVGLLTRRTTPLKPIAADFMQQLIVSAKALVSGNGNRPA